MKKFKCFFSMDRFLIVFLSLSVLFGIYVAFIKPDAYSLETLKVWGRTNMKMATQLYKSDMYKDQQRTTLEQIIGSIQPQVAPIEDVVANDVPALVLEDTKLAAIMKGAHIKGNKKARITLVTYSDFLCSYCRRHYTDQTLEKLVEKYPNEVNMVFKHFPINTPIWAQWSLCVGKLAGTDKYYQYIAKWFAAQEYTEASVTELAVSLGVNKSKFTTCLNNPETMAELTASSQEAQWFGMNWTPGNLVIDNEKGTYVVIAGAYPMEAFEAEITKILK